MSDSKVIMFPEGTNGTSQVDPNLLLTSIMNNGGFGNNGNWIWIVFLFLLWGRNGYGFNGNDGTSYLSNQINNGTGRDLLMQAINGNGAALNNLASTLNCDVNSIKTAINGVQSSICQVGNQVGMSAADVKNAITTGNMGLAQQLAQCCCDSKLLASQNHGALISRIDQLANGITQGFSATAYETAQQTCALQNSLRDNTANVIAKLDAIEDARKDREIAALTAQLTASTSRAERAAELAPITKALNDIQCKQPNTITVPYQPFITVPNCVAWNGGLYNQNGSIWS